MSMDIKDCSIERLLLSCGHGKVTNLFGIYCLLMARYLSRSSRGMLVELLPCETCEEKRVMQARTFPVGGGVILYMGLSR